MKDKEAKMRERVEAHNLFVLTKAHIKTKYPEYYSLRKLWLKSWGLSWAEAILMGFTSGPTALCMMLLILLTCGASARYDKKAKMIYLKAEKEAKDVLEKTKEAADTYGSASLIFSPEEGIMGILAEESAEVLDPPEKGRELTDFEIRCMHLMDEAEEYAYPGYEGDIEQLEGLMQGYYLEDEDPSLVDAYEEAFKKMETTIHSKIPSQKVKQDASVPLEIIPIDNIKALQIPEEDRILTDYEARCDSLARAAEKSGYPGATIDAEELEGLMQGYYLEGDDPALAAVYQDALREMEVITKSKGIARKRRKK